LVLACARGGHAEGIAPAQPPGGSIVPKPEALAPKAFTLEERYLDAARRGDLDVLTRCLDKGVDPRAKDGFARSALLLAVLNARNLEMVKFLQSRGLPVDDPDVRGRTPLGYAAGNGQLEMVSYLLEQGAAADRKDGRTDAAVPRRADRQQETTRAARRGRGRRLARSVRRPPLWAPATRDLTRSLGCSCERAPTGAEGPGRSDGARARPAGASFCRNLRHQAGHLDAGVVGRLD
jgi:hypothetical protein